MPYSRCRACGFRFANPVPPDEVLSAFYNSSFYANYRRLEENRIATGNYFSISTDIGTMRHLATWLGDDRSLKILDYGCGPGTFMALLRDEFGFYNVDGLELNSQGIEIGRRYYGVTIASSTAALQHTLYDCIVLLEVIEHVPKPDAFLEQVTALLKPNGCLVIATPAVDNPVGRFLPWYSNAPYSAPCHISLFTKKALTCLLSRFSFKIERIETSESWAVMQNVVASLVYDLDIMSPHHDDDFNDLLYTPNALGRRLGLKPRRALSNFFFPLRVADYLLLRIARYVPGMPMNGHMHVLARR